MKAALYAALTIVCLFGIVLFNLLMYAINVLVV